MPKACSILIWVCLASGAFAGTASTPAPSAITAPSPPVAASSTILPEDFAGWHTGDIRRSQDASVADSTDVALLKECGFTAFESATFTRDGRTLQVKAARFADVSGTLAAFAAYREPPMQRESIGDQAASFNERILFSRGNVLVQARFEKLTAMSASELRELANELPLPTGNAAIPPKLVNYLPQRGIVENSARYVLGPVGLKKAGGSLSPDLVDFGVDAEVVLGRYITAEGMATLVIVNYPTNEIATDRLRHIDTEHQTAASSDRNGPPVVQVGELFARRSGPLVAVVSGAISKNEARSLLGSVNYQADVTWNENTFFHKFDNPNILIFNVFLLAFVMAGLAIVAGITFGGIRVALNRFWPGHRFAQPEGDGFISLGLAEQGEKPPKPGASPSIKIS